jgi:hypothetical protein
MRIDCFFFTKHAPLYACDSTPFPPQRAPPIACTPTPSQPQSHLLTAGAQYPSSPPLRSNWQTHVSDGHEPQDGDHALSLGATTTSGRSREQGGHAPLPFLRSNGCADDAQGLLLEHATRSTFARRSPAPSLCRSNGSSRTISVRTRCFGDVMERCVTRRGVSVPGRRRCRIISHEYRGDRCRITMNIAEQAAPAVWQLAWHISLTEHECRRALRLMT